MQDDPHELALAIGGAIRSRRRSLGWSMAALAERAGLSQPYLSKVERGVGRLSIPAIDRVAKALGTSAVGLLAGIDGSRRVDVVRRGERKTFSAFADDQGTGYTVTRRAGQLGVVEFDDGPIDFAPTPFVHRNDSVCLILSGSYEFEVDADLITLNEGDSLSVSGGVAERYRVLGPGARMLLIFVSEDVEVLHHPATGWSSAPGDPS